MSWSITVVASNLPIIILLSNSVCGECMYVDLWYYQAHSCYSNFRMHLLRTVGRIKIQLHTFLCSYQLSSSLWLLEFLNAPSSGTGNNKKIRTQEKRERENRFIDFRLYSQWCHKAREGSKFHNNFWMRIRFILLIVKRENGWTKEDFIWKVFFFRSMKWLKSISSQLKICAN